MEPLPFDQSIYTEICDKIATSNIGIIRILNSDDKYPKHNTFYKWIKNSNESEEQYARAREAQADFLVDEILEIADETSNDTITISNGDYDKEVENKEWINRSKLKVDARRWIASKFRPTKYGDKLDIDHKTNGKELTATAPTFNIYTNAPKLASNESEIEM